MGAVDKIHGLLEDLEKNASDLKKYLKLDVK
mgnify:CR=1 FL=1